MNVEQEVAKQEIAKDFPPLLFGLFVFNRIVLYFPDWCYPCCKEKVIFDRKFGGIK